MCVLGDAAEAVARLAPFEMAVAEGGLVVSGFANEDHARDYVRALQVLVEVYLEARE